MMGNVIEEVEAGGVVAVGADPIYVTPEAAESGPAAEVTEAAAASR
jgi:hypothetical protein